MCTANPFLSQMRPSRPSSSEEELSLDERADRHVRRLEGFYAHLASYVGVNALLVGINLFTLPDNETERLRRRVEHLEAIVTSVDWDLVLAPPSDERDAERQTARLADEVVAR